MKKLFRNQPRLFFLVRQTRVSTCIGRIAKTRYFGGVFIKGRRYPLHSRFPIHAHLSGASIRLDIQLIFIPHFLHEVNLLRVFLSPFVVSADNHRFNNAFKYRPVELRHRIMLFQNFSKFDDTLLHTLSRQVRFGEFV